MKPTYLYIKQHSITGKLYFGKTIKKDPEKYLGSGKRWGAHVKVHGKDLVETLWYCLFTESEEIKSFALMCSEQWGIVKSDSWLNLKPENGIDGGGCPGRITSILTRQKQSLSLMNHPVSVSTRKKISLRVSGNVNIINYMRNRVITAETCNRMCNAKLGKKQHPDLIKKRSLGMIGKKQTNIVCPHCGQSGGNKTMPRWHFDNCKNKE